MDILFRVEDIPVDLLEYFEEVKQNGLTTAQQVVSEPFQDAHFAKFGRKWIEPCIKAGTSERGACACGAPWVRVVERSGEWRAQHTRPAKHNGDVYRTNPGGGLKGPHTSTIAITTGWRPSCTCPDAAVSPCTVLDPFVGSGTTVYVAKELNRKGIGIDLNADYLAMARKRLRQEVLPLGYR